MSAKRRVVAIVVGAVIVAGVAYFLVRGKADIPLLGGPTVCPLTGQKPSSDKLLDHPAVAVKIENSPAAYPLAGLDKADVVFEEVVEGGVTRFMAVYQCGDSSTAGPVRSARVVDPGILTPITKILAFSGANKPVLDALSKAGIVQVTETSSQGALSRIARSGYSSEHTLYADTSAVRKVGEKNYSDAPPDDTFKFGDLGSEKQASKPAASVTLDFSAASTITYDYKGGEYLRSQTGQPFTLEDGKQVAVDNVLVESHTVDNSKTIVDVAGNPSTEIADVTGSGKAVLFRDGRAITGTWSRGSVDDTVKFSTSSGDDMVLAPGTTWVELVPNDKGDVKGSFSYEG